MTQTETIKSAYNGLFLNRPGVRYRELTLALLEPPEEALEEGDKAAFYDYEHQLYDTVLNSHSTVGEAIKAIKGDDSEAPILFARAFVDGLIDLSEYQVPDFIEIQDVVRWLAEGLEDGSISIEDVVNFAKKSRDVYQKDMEEALLGAHEINADQTKHVRFVLDPGLLLHNMEDLFEARELLRNELSTYEGSYDPLGSSKRSIVEVYLARVNELIATCLPRIGYLYEQAIIIGDTKTLGNIKELVSEPIYEIIKNPQARTRLLQRLDHLRNGAGGYESDLPFKEAMVTDMEKSQDESLNPIFNEQDRQQLQRYELEPEAIKELIEVALSEKGLLSCEPSSTWSPSRRHRASDDKYQVVIDPNAGSFMVDYVSGVYKVPPDRRSLYDILTVAFGHELTHINQGEAERALSNRLKICEDKAKRVSILRESGANTTQRHIEKLCFGKSKPFTFTYMAALQVLESGGSLYDASMAFYQTKRQAFPDIDPRKAAQEATNRVMRLLRGGGYNSQPLAYSEEAVIEYELDGLSPQEKARATLITNIDLVDQLRLHRFGLMPQPDLATVDWADYIMSRIVPLFKELIDDYTASNNIHRQFSSGHQIGRLIGKKGGK